MQTPLVKGTVCILMGGVGYRTNFDAAVGFVNGAGLGDGSSFVLAGCFDDENGADDFLVSAVRTVFGSLCGAGYCLAAVSGTISGDEFAGLGELADPSAPMLNIGLHGIVG